MKVELTNNLFLSGISKNESKELVDPLDFLLQSGMTEGAIKRASETPTGLIEFASECGWDGRLWIGDESDIIESVAKQFVGYDGKNYRSYAMKKESYYTPTASLSLKSAINKWHNINNVAKAEYTEDNSAIEYLYCIEYIPTYEEYDMSDYN